MRGRYYLFFIIKLPNQDGYEYHTSMALYLFFDRMVLLPSTIVLAVLVVVIALVIPAALVVPLLSY